MKFIYNGLRSSQETVAQGWARRRDATDLRNTNRVGPQRNYRVLCACTENACKRSSVEQRLANTRMLWPKSRLDCATQKGLNPIAITVGGQERSPMHSQ